MPSGLTSRLSGLIRMVGMILSDHPNLRPTIPKSLLEICQAVAHNALHNPVGTAQLGVSGVFQVQNGQKSRGICLPLLMQTLFLP